MNKFFGMALLAAGLCLAVTAQTTQSYPFAGTWKLNVAKSKFSPGPAPKSATVAIGEDGKVDYQGETADGQATKWSVMMTSDGTPATISGMEGSTVTEKRIDERTVEHTWKYPKSTTNGKAVLSKDGKSMTYTMTGTTDEGKPIREREFWEKQ
jgi:hypothetical protein